MSEMSLQDLQQSLIPQLMDYAFETFGPKLLDEAWHEFYGQADDAGFQPDDPLNVLFLPWFLFNWPLDLAESRSPSAPCLCEAFIADRQDRLLAQELEFLNAAIKRPYTFCEVLEKLPGVKLRLVDLMQQKELIVSEKNASKSLEVGEIIFCATMLPVFDVLRNIAIGPVAIPGLLKNEVLELRDELLKKTSTDTVDEKSLEAESSFLIGRYLDFREELEESGDDGD